MSNDVPDADGGVLGLRRGEVRLVPSSAEWAHLFARERDVLLAAAGPMDITIEHVGSTSVPGLAAKPILDIAVAVATTGDIHRLRERLAGHKYIDRGDGGADGGWLLVKESAPDIRTHHIHVVTKDDPQWGGYLHFRDLLRRDPDARDAYAREKRRLELAFRVDRGAYTDGKQDIISSLVERESPC